METAETMWAGFTAATGVHAEYASWGFGDSPEMLTELALLVRDGPKRATAGLLAEYADGKPLPTAGEYSVILDGEGAAVCVIRTTSVEIRRFDDVDADFAWTEGEGDRSLGYWRDEHIGFFERCGMPLTGDTEMVLERFDLVWPETR